MKKGINILTNSRQISYRSILIAMMYFIVLFIMFFLLPYLMPHPTNVLIAFNIMAGSINGRFMKDVRRELTVLSVLINNYCNLKCKHCYLQARKFDTYLKPSEWEKFFISVFIDNKPDTLCFAGKEVFFNQESAEILFNAVRLRDHIQGQYKKTQIGVITNGTLLMNYRDSILQTPPDYFDISIDGLPHLHDEIRGKGSFEITEKNLKWLIRNFTGNIWITHTILQNNLQTLPEFVCFMHKHFGIAKFSIGLYKEKVYTEAGLKLSQDDVRNLFDSTIHKLEKLKLHSSVEIIMEMDHTQNEFIPILLESGWVQKSNLLSSTSHHLSDRLKLTFNVAHIPVGLWRSVRVTPEGYWLAAEDLMEVKKYNELAVANLRDFDFNSDKLYESGLQSQRFRELMGEKHEVIEKKLFLAYQI